MCKSFSSLFCGTKQVTWPSQIQGWGNRLHIMIEGSKTSHCKDMNSRKGRICSICVIYTFQGKDGNLSDVISLNQKVHWEESKKCRTQEYIFATQNLRIGRSLKCLTSLMLEYSPYLSGRMVILLKLEQPHIVWSIPLLIIFIYQKFLSPGNFVSMILFCPLSHRKCLIVFQYNTSENLK